MKIKSWLDKNGNVAMSEIKLDEQDIICKSGRNLTDEERERLFEVDGIQRLK